MMEDRDEPSVDRLAELTFGTRSSYGLYDLRQDPRQRRNAATESLQAKRASVLDARLMAHLAYPDDPRPPRSADTAGLLLRRKKGHSRLVS